MVAVLPIPTEAGKRRACLLILYGKANPVDAIELLGPNVQGIHAKDGLWPTNPRLADCLIRCTFPKTTK
jgi:hypothetical protein